MVAPSHLSLDRILQQNGCNMFLIGLTPPYPSPGCRMKHGTMRNTSYREHPLYGTTQANDNSSRCTQRPNGGECLPIKGSFTGVHVHTRVLLRVYPTCVKCL